MDSDLYNYFKEIRNIRLSEKNNNLILTVDHKRLNQKIDKLLETLDKKQQDIIKFFFGLDDGQEHTLEETALKFNLTKERIKQIKLKALDKLKNNK